MTNAEKYLKEGADVEKLGKELGFYLENTLDWDWQDGIAEFFNQKSSFTLTEDERVILRNIRENYKAIGRDDVGELYISEYFDDDTRDVVEFAEFKDNIFQFIKERRKISYKGVARR